MLIPDQEPSMRTLSGGRRLEITNADLSDSGVYKCAVSNPAGKTSRQFNLEVWGKTLTKVECAFRSSSMFSSTAN